jgi:hypothetical protein
MIKKSQNTNTLDQNIGNYKETNLPIWLVLSQRQIDTNNQQWAYINDEISKIKDDSPFYLTAQYYNLLAKSKDIKNKESIKPIIDNLISQTNNSQQFIAQNLFNDLMFNLTDSLIEKQKYSLMNIVDFYWTEWDSISFPPYYQYLNESDIYKEKQYFLSYKMKEMLVKTDIDKLNDFLSNENIFNPKNKQYLRLGLYIKSILNNRLDISKNMSQLLAKNNALLAKDLSAFNRSQNIEEQIFLAAKFILDYPGITDVNSQSFDEFSVYNVENIKEIDNYRRNWDFEDDCVMYGYPDYYEEKDKTKGLNIDSKDLLTNKIGEIVINYATKNPEHGLVPEALSKVVDLVHYGSCADKQSPEYAKRSFQFLHLNYPNSYWAKQTPYWYEH